MKVIRSIILISCLLFLSAGPVVAQGEITITDLGTLGGANSYAYNLNNLGQVVGASETADGSIHAFLWTAETGMIDLGTLAGGIDSEAWGINDAGQVVGVSVTPDWQYLAFLWTAESGMSELGTLGGSDSWALGINNFGQVVGGSANPFGEWHAFLWTETSGMEDLGTFGSGGYSEAFRINDSGQVVGWSDPGWHAFLWMENNMLDLGTLGGSTSEAGAINNLGQVVGGSKIADGSTHAFLWTAESGMVDLGTLGGAKSFARGINDFGQVAGDSEAPDGYRHAFLWTEASGMTDLGTLEGLSSSVFGINEIGQIVGYSNTLNGDTHATLWTIPSTQLPPDELTNMLIGDVYSLVDSGMLNQGQGNSLIVKLQHALAHLANDNPKNACSSLSAFSNQVNSLVEESVLSPEDGGSLLNSANEISIQVCE